MPLALHILLVTISVPLAITTVYTCRHIHQRMAGSGYASRAAAISAVGSIQVGLATALMVVGASR